MNKIFKLISIAAVAFSAASCNDFFELKPQNELVLDEFWQSESDVLSVTGSCYRTMQEGGFMERLFIWGEFRGDNVILGNGDGGDISNIANLNLLASNNYAYWGDFYKVINLCNTVEHFAPIARQKDPNFTQNNLNGYIAEVKGIRAFCYFTLVRAFRDVPLVLDPVIDDTQSFQVPQSSPEEILDFLISDLKSVENTAFTSWTNTAYTKGRMTQNAIRALIADMSLWLGRYEDCVTYCDKIMNDVNNVITLEMSPAYNMLIFVDGNSTESIFELQFNRSSSTVANSSLIRFYGTDGSSSPVMNAFDFSSTELFAETDLRGHDAFYPSTSGVCPIKKYVSYRPNPGLEFIQQGNYNDLGYSVGNCNWIIYRLPDVFLMKAEALVELNQNLPEAYNLVCRTFDRANPDLEPGMANPGASSSQDAMRTLVFEERQREFMFEGKRYFDIIRMINRDRSRFSTIVNQYLVPKYADLDQATVKSKLSEYDALFMPIKDSELKANLQLVQNPFYKTSSDIGIGGK